MLPEFIINRAYYMVYHESARDLARVRTVADFITEAAQRDKTDFHPLASS